MVLEALKHLELDHIAVAVHDLDQAEKLFCKLLQSQVFHRETIEAQQVRVSFLDLGDQNLELLESLTGDGPVASFLEKRGEGMHHIAFKVKDIRREMLRLNNAGFKILQKEPMTGAFNKLVCFIHPKSTTGVLVEICEDQQNT